MVELTALQRLRAFLDPSPDIAGVEAQNAARTGQRGVDRNALLTAAEKPEAERRAIINDLATRYSTEIGFKTSQEIGNAVNEFIQNTTSRFEPATPIEKPVAQGPGALERFAQGFAERPKQGLAGSTGDIVTPAIHSLQEEQLLKEFDDALEHNDEGEMQRLIDQSLAIGGEKGLLHRQFDLAKQNLGQISDRQFDDYRAVRGQKMTRAVFEADLAEKLARAKEKAEKYTPKTDAEKKAAEVAAKREEELRRNLSTALASNNITQKRGAYQQLVQHQIAQTQPFSFFIEYYDQGQINGLLNTFSNAVQQRIQEARQQRASRMQRLMQATQQGAAQMENDKINAANQVKKTVKKNVKKLVEQGLEAAADAIVPGAGEAIKAAFFIKKHWKMFLFLALLLLILIIAGFVAIFMLIASVFQSQQQDQQQQLQVAKCIQTDTDTMNSVPPILSLIKSRFHVTITGDLTDPNKATSPVTLLGAKKLFTYTCMLFGHTSTDIGTNQLNTFGTFVTLPSDGGLGVIINTTVSSTGQACTTSFAKQTGNTITWNLQDFASCSEGKGRFLLGKAYADIAVRQLRQEKIRNRQSRQNIFDTFTLQFANAKSLPTTNCSTTTGSAHSLGCFTDMVGSYFSYPLYFDSTSSQTNFLTLVSDFANYYFFAKTNLFDDVEFFHQGHPTPPNYPADLRLAIAQTFGITMNGFPQIELKWAWEKLWDISNTKFVPLVRNGHVTMYSQPNGTAYTFCSNGACQVHLHEFGDQEGFDVIFTHELGHVISFMNPDSSSHRSGIPGAVVSDFFHPVILQGWLTFYSELACLYHPPTLGVQLGEDYAETIAYYLNPKVGMLTACGHGDNPYANGNHPAHFSLAQKILGLY